MAGSDITAPLPGQLRAPLTATGVAAFPTSTVLQCAQTVVALAIQLQTGMPSQPARTLEAVTAAIESFESALVEAGHDERTVVTASYLICVWLDEATAHHDWVARAGSQTSMLSHFHGTQDGGRRVFQVLDRLLQQPAHDRALLELFHVCLSLGFQGRDPGAPDGTSPNEDWRRRIATALNLQPGPLSVTTPVRKSLASSTPPLARPGAAASASGALGAPLSTRWLPAVTQRSKDWEPRILFGGLVLLAGLSLAVFITCNWMLAAQVDEVFSSLRGIELAGQSQESPPPMATTDPTLANSQSGSQRQTPIPSRIAGHRDGLAPHIKVRDEAHRSVIDIPTTGMFQADSADLTPAGRETVARVAQVLATQKGRVLVTAWAREDSPRPLRLPSASQLADAWALQVVAQLTRQARMESITSEGRVARGDSQARIEVTLFP